ncbi:hypothetical protein A2Z67_03760 [Candidatus Woesebacteria bacterium RBG_13_36_22]|uniref:HNH nuclease domain-containing protein n=1 Tax=Candidatus Woesebacteria bacterium RBG_13_36_22 TaxID=1802478 RepID=A0A1F7X2G9_9BACT|nr:MAG: hypothetical protein A2Z67_03760 [Candidatus Woesebacteria bacterium RBG_13_36_22]
MTKAERQKVYDKFGGRCAYCGQIITPRQMQVDHINPKLLSHWLKSDIMREELKTDITDINAIENLNPSCRLCNNFKTFMTLEEFRIQLSKQVSRIKSTQFDRALKFGQITLTPKPIMFYYEVINDKE